MADCFTYYDVRDAFLAVARRYDVLASRADNADQRSSVPADLRVNAAD